MHVMAGAAQGGAENIFLESVLALTEAPVDQFVVTRPNNQYRLDQFRAKNVAVATASFNKWVRFSTRQVINQAIRQFDPDIIQYWMGRAGTFATKGRAKNIGWYGGYYKIERFKHCDFHIGLTKDLVRHIVDQGIASDRAAVIHTFADFSQDDPTPRSSLDTPDDAPLLLALARLHAKKGLDVLLKAMVHVPRAYLWIAGEGPLERQLEQLCTSLGLDPRVRFLGWRNDRNALLKAADICVFPSRYEPFGTVTVDAWAAAIPLIASKAVGPKAYVTHEENGLLVEIDDSGGLAEAINLLIGNKELREKIVAGGTRSFTKQFTKEVFITESMSLYEKVLRLD